MQPAIPHDEQPSAVAGLAARTVRFVLCFMTFCVGFEMRAASALAPADVQRIRDELGIALDEATQNELAAIVQPAVVEAWRVAAEARIDTNRKAALSISVRDANGLPLSGAEVSVRQTSRPFVFGGVLDLKIFDGSSVNQPNVSTATYKARAVAMFDAFGLNNGLKPKQRSTNEALLPGFFAWAASVQRPVRGHLLIWPGQDHLSAEIETKTAQIEALVAARNSATDQATIANYNAQIETLKPGLRTAVDEEISGWAAKWDVFQWDVMNEPLSNTRLQAILGDSEMVRWYQLAAANRVRAGAPLLVNDFQIIAGRNDARIAPYKAVIDYLLANGAPLSGIGFQSRFKFQREDPALLYSRLEQFASYNLPLFGTEFEVVDNTTGGVNFVPSETLRAQMTEEVMTTYFSHPAVQGLFAWDFLTPGDSSALFDTNGTPKLNGLVWYYLSRIRYSTRSLLNTDAAGAVNLRAFKGDYEVVVRYGGSEVTRAISLSGDVNQTITTPFYANRVTRSIAAAADTFVRRDQPTSNFGANNFIDLRRSSGTAGRLAYLRFEVAAASGDITEVRLRVKVPATSLTPSPETDAMAVYSPADATSWTESGLTWNNRPPVGTLLASAQGPADSWVEFTLPTSVVPAAGGSVTLILDEQADTYGRLQSREAGFGPVLSVVESLDHDGDGIADSVDPDDDNDGMPDAWEIAAGLDARSSSDALGDVDFDGRPNLLEYLLGRNPAVGEPLSADLDLQFVAGGYRLKWRRRAVDQSPAVAFSRDLVTWQVLRTPGEFAAANLSVLSSSSTADGATHESVQIDFSTTTSDRKLFFRLQH